MGGLLKLALAMDWVSEKFGWLASWAVMLTALISALNAFVRYGLGWTSNAAMEVQWYLFAYTFMVGAPQVLKLNEHVRVDLIYGKLKGHGPVYVDLFGLLVFLLPAMGFLCYLCVPYFYHFYESGQGSDNAGGLARVWWVALSMPLGFGLVFLQGVAEVIKRLAYLQGIYQMDTHYEKPLQ